MTNNEEPQLKKQVWPKKSKKIPGQKIQNNY